MWAHKRSERPIFHVHTIKNPYRHCYRGHHSQTIKCSCWEFASAFMQAILQQNEKRKGCQQFTLIEPRKKEADRIKNGGCSLITDDWWLASLIGRSPCLPDPDASAPLLPGVCDGNSEGLPGSSCDVDDCPPVRMPPSENSTILLAGAFLPDRPLH